MTQLLFLLFLVSDSVKVLGRAPLLALICPPKSNAVSFGPSGSGAFVNNRLPLRSPIAAIQVDLFRLSGSVFYFPIMHETLSVSLLLQATFRHKNRCCTAEVPLPDTQHISLWRPCASWRLCSSVGTGRPLWGPALVSSLSFVFFIPNQKNIFHSPGKALFLNFTPCKHLTYAQGPSES